MRRLNLFGLGDGSEGLRELRALRATPPGLADDGRRGKTFAGGLEQFEQLIEAGAALPATSAPILLFYALSQGGRSLLAAHRPQPWQTHGHGLGIRVDRSDLGKTAVVPAGDDGLFPAVAATSGSAALTTELSLDEIWGAIPNLDRVYGLGAEQPPSFVIDTRKPDSPVVRDERGSLLRDAEDFLRHRGVFPQLAEVEINHHKQGDWSVITLDFKDDPARARFESSLWDRGTQRYLLPHARPQPSELMLWWCLLQALGHLARYEPATWIAVLDPDCSVFAVPLEAAIERAIALLPDLLLAALKLEDG